MPAANQAGNNLMKRVYGPENLSNNEAMHAAYPQRQPTALNYMERPAPGVSNEAHFKMLANKSNKLSAMNNSVMKHGNNVQAYRLRQKHKIGGRRSRKARKTRKHKRTRRH